jgi:hypothetical protein
VGEDQGQGVAEQAFVPGALVGILDVVPGVVDEVHVVHAGGAGAHAGEAGEAAVDVADDFLRGRAAGFQHVLDEVDAAAGGIELVAEEDEGGARGGAEAAMDAGAELLVGFRGVGVAELGFGEGGLHG